MKNHLLNLSLDYAACIELLDIWQTELPEGRLSLSQKKHAIISTDEKGASIFEFRLPLPMPAILEEEELEDYIDRLEEDIPPYTMMLMQMGAAALGYFEDGEPYQHKAFKKYMKRHGQGKAQISYLNTRGKSKAGSRIRLANTIRFFEEVNERMTDWEEMYEPERILYSCTPQLWGLLFQSKVSPPFEKKDHRLIKIPLHVHIPDFEELQRINKQCLKGSLEVYQSVEIPGVHG
ncbi:MAG: hypothetical protein AAF135_07635 [Bacteroidota bacterium]